MNKKNACIIYNGCPEAGIDLACIKEYLKLNGWNITGDYKNADLILFSACSLIVDNIKYSQKIIQTIQKNKKISSKLIITGCLPKTDPDILKNNYEGIIIEDDNLSSLLQIQENNLTYKMPVANYILTPAGRNGMFKRDLPILIRIFGAPFFVWQGYLESKFNLVNPYDQSIFYVKVATGCLGACSYCSIRKSKGTINSKSITEIISEFRTGLEKGYKKFSLIGTDVGAYGRDIDYTLIDLLSEMIKENGSYKIGIRNINPYFLKKMLNELIPIIKTQKIWYISSAPESGSNRIIKLMNRKYTIEEYKECIQKIRNSYPNIVIRTQLMVGFPGETEQDFNETIRLLNDVVFDYVEVYKFSARPETPAWDMRYQIPKYILEKRYRKLYTKALLNRTPRKIRLILTQNKLRS